ncbi:MAG: hypothetical protein II716_11865, partial [Treponema sp.]|nr:hypothetical protein [Treponema sp.]
VKKNDISTWCYDATGPENLSFSDVKGNVGSTSSEDNVIVKDNTIYYRADATEISFTVATSTDGHGDAQYANGTSDDDERTSGSLAISVDGTESTASIYAWDGVGNVCATPLTLTFVPVAAPSVTLTAGAKDGVDKIHTNPKTESGTTWNYYATDEVEITPTVTVDSNAATVGTTGYVYKAGGTEVPAGAFDITGLDSTKKYTLSEVGGFGRTVTVDMPKIDEKENWRSYVKPTGCSYTETIDDTTDDDGAVTGHHLKYVITFPAAAPGVPVMDVIATSTHNLEGTTLTHSSDGWDKTFGALTDGVYKLVDSAGMGWNTTITIEYDDTSDTTAETITAITVNTRFGTLSVTKASASVSAFARSRGIDLASIVADDTEISDISAVTRSPNIIRYFSAYDLNEKSEPAARFKGPDTFAIGNKVETVKDEIVKKSVTNELSVGYADREIEEPLVTGSHRWTIAQDAEDAQEVAVVSVDSGNDSVGIVEARDFQTEENGSETGKKPLNPLWFIGFAAIFSALAIILQKKRQN